jgi:hypothetical protein
MRDIHFMFDQISDYNKDDIQRICSNVKYIAGWKEPFRQGFDTDILMTEAVKIPSDKSMIEFADYVSKWAHMDVKHSFKISVNIAPMNKVVFNTFKY